MSLIMEHIHKPLYGKLFGVTVFGGKGWYFIIWLLKQIER